MMKSTKHYKKNMSSLIIEKKIKHFDSLELPMDEKFYTNLHNKIMQSVEKTEVKPLSRWAKTWVFLEKKGREHKALTKKAIKVGIAGISLSLAIGLINLSSQIYSEAYALQNASNKTRILIEAKQDPTEWSDLDISYQNESDFYADILSQRSATIVEIDRVITESL